MQWKGEEMISKGHEIIRNNLDLQKAMLFYFDKFLTLRKEVEKEFPGIGEKAIFPAMEEYLWRLFSLVVNKDPNSEIVERMHIHFTKVKEDIEKLRPDLIKEV